MVAEGESIGLQGDVKARVGETPKAMDKVKILFIIKSVSLGVRRELFKKRGFISDEVWTGYSEYEREGETQDRCSGNKVSMKSVSSDQEEVGRKVGVGEKMRISKCSRLNRSQYQLY